MDINIDALYNILKQNQEDVNDAMGSKKKTFVVTSDPLALIAEKTNVSRSKEKVVVSSDPEGSKANDFNELKKITALLAKYFNRRKFYSKPTNNNLRTLFSYQSANKKQEFVKTDTKKVEKKDDEKKRDMSRVKCYKCKKEGHFAKDCKKAKVKDYEYYKTKMLLAKKDKDEQVLLAKDQAWMESSSDSDQEINKNMVFMAQIEKVLSHSEAISSSVDEKIFEVSYYLSESESKSEFETSEYYDNSTNYGLFVSNDDDQEIFHVAIESASENFIENHIDSLKDYDKSDVDHNDSEEKDQLVDKLIRKFNKKIVKCQNRVEKANQQSKDFEDQNKDLQDKYDVLKNLKTTFEMNNNELNEQMKEDLKNTVLEKDFKISELEECVRNKDLEIEKCLEGLNVCENKLHKMGQTNQTVHMMMPSKDNLYNGRKGIGFENPSYFKKAKDLRPTLYDEKVIGLGYTPMFLLHSDEALEIERFKRSRENKIEFAYDYGNLNAKYDKEENPKVIAPEKIKLNVSQCVSPISMSKSSCDSKNVEIKLKRKRHLDTFSSVRRPKNSGVIWKKKGPSNTSNIGLSAVSVSNLNKNVKRYSRKDLLACNNSHLGETSSAYMCNDAMNVSCNFRMNDLLDDNYFFIFDDVNVRISPQMTGNRALLANFVEKFLGTVRFGNNDFAVIAGYGDVKTQVNLQLQVQRVRTDNSTEFKNKTLAKFFDEAEAIATVCFTQNHSIIHKRFDKTPYELMNKRKLNFKFFRVFGCRCYLLNDYEDVGKLKEKGDIGVFVGYSKESAAFRIYKKQTRKIHESMNVNFDELFEMATKQFSLETGLSNLNEMKKSSNPLVLQVSKASKKDLEDLFQDFYDEYFDSSKVMKSSTTNVETSINDEVFHEIFESF
nr:hypothetical protein [Tanacetum cinerariifolium]